MPVTPTYPGVYIEEVPSGVHTITGVATSIGAFVDTFTRGPLNQALRILSFADFERDYGGLRADSEASYAIQQFFRNGGSEAYVVRVGTVGVGGLANATALLRRTPNPASGQVVNVQAGRRIRGVSVRDPGQWGNSIRLEVDYDTTDPTEFFNLTAMEIAMAAGQLTVLRTETYRNLTLRPGAPNNAIEAVNESSRLIQLDRNGLPALPAFPTDFRPAATGTLGNPIAATPIPPTGRQINVNAGGGPKVATISYAGTISDFATYRPVLEAAIRAADPGDPLIAGASVTLLNTGVPATPIRFLVTAGRGGSSFDPTVKLNFSNVGADSTASSLGITAAANVQQYSLAGGTDLTAPIVSATFATFLRGSQVAKTGLYALEDVDLFNILCVPAAATLTATDLGAVISDYEAYCGLRRAFLLVDIPPGVIEPANMLAWMAQNDTLRDRNAAVYYPRPMIADSLNDNRLRGFGASGTIAGLFARTDAARGVWKAPAGTETRLRGVQDLAYRLTDGQNGTLNPLGINSLRSFPVYGNVCWGARTLDGADQQASEWKYVPIRRMALFLEESLYRGTKWVVFEPNDEPLWAQIRLNIGAFMHNLFVQGAFQGKSPRDAYFVKCDSETTTQNDIDNGIVNIVVGFAPLKPAEFVILKIQQIAGQIQT